MITSALTGQVSYNFKTNFSIYILYLSDLFQPFNASMLQILAISFLHIDEFWEKLFSIKLEHEAFNGHMMRKYENRLVHN